MQPVFHYAPSSGWLNDPNGLIRYNDRHHLFYQHNPDVAEGHAFHYMHWGHASSTDLVTWTEHPVALKPGGVNRDGNGFDDDGCWSGCAVDTGDGVIALYTGFHDGNTLPCIAYAADKDLITWDKYPGNPVIAEKPPIEGLADFRDHSLRRAGQSWQQAVAGGAAGTAALYGYRSRDLLNWTYEGILVEAVDGLPGTVWECPDVFVTGDQAVAIVSVIEEGKDNYVIWITGQITDARLTPAAWGLLDLGDRMYAPQSYWAEEDRRVLFGWLRLQLDQAAFGQENLGAMSVPRDISVRDGRVLVRPAPELSALRRAELRSASEPGAGTAWDCPDRPDAVEILLDGDAQDDLDGCRVRLRDGASGAELTVDIAAVAAEPACWRRAGSGWAAEPGTARSARLLFDRGLVEVFLDDGRAACFSDLRLSALSGIRAEHGKLRATARRLSPEGPAS